jgi:hypothetical protein
VPQRRHSASSPVCRGRGVRRAHARPLRDIYRRTLSCPGSLLASIESSGFAGQAAQWSNRLGSANGRLLSAWLRWQQLHQVSRVHCQPVPERRALHGHELHMPAKLDRGVLRDSCSRRQPNDHHQVHRQRSLRPRSLRRHCGLPDACVFDAMREVFHVQHHRRERSMRPRWPSLPMQRPLHIWHRLHRPCTGEVGLQDGGRCISRSGLLSTGHRDCSVPRFSRPRRSSTSMLSVRRGDGMRGIHKRGQMRSTKLRATDDSL